MPFTKKNKIITILAVLGILLFLVVYFFTNFKSQGLEELKRKCNSHIEQAEKWKDIQLDSAWNYANEAKVIVEQEPDLILEKNKAILLCSEIDFLRSGASDELCAKVQACEDWFRENELHKRAFQANLFRLKLKSFLNGKHSVEDDMDGLFELANQVNSNSSKAHAYYFKMDQRDYTRKWDDDVHILDSARLFASKAGDSVLLSKIRMMSVLPINGSKASIDSTLVSLKEAERWNSPELKCIVYSTMALRFYPSRKLDTAMYYLDKGLQESIKWKSSIYEMYAVQGMSEAYGYSSVFDSTDTYSKKALKLAEKTGNSASQIDLLFSIALNHMKKGEYSKAVDFTMKSLELSKKTKYKAGIFSSQQFLIGNLIKTERFDEAERIADEMFEIQKRKESNHVNDLNSAEVNYLKGQTKFYKKEYDRALEYFHKSRDLLNAHSIKGKKLFLTDIAIFKTFMKSERMLESEEHYEYMLSKYAEAYLNTWPFQYRKGTLMDALGKDDEAIVALEKTIENRGGVSGKQHYKACFLLRDILEEKGDFVQALVYNKKGIEIKDEIDKKKDALTLEKLQSQYKIAEKESEIQQLDIERLEQKNDLESQENTLQRRRLFIILLSVLLVLLVLIVVLIYRRSKEVRIREELKRKTLEQEREVERLKTEESERTIELKNQLFANISHEFRTPLTLINAPVEELWEKVDAAEKNKLEVIKRNSDHLLEMVDEILELSRLDAEKTVLSMKPFGLNSFIQKLQLNFEPLLKQKGIGFTTTLPAELHTVTGDEYRLKMVLNNLLKNALHHTPKSGEIVVRVKADENQGQLNLSVFNSGDWIDEEFLPSIFERYARSKEKEYSGYGIGLSFCKKIVELHDGTISAQNVEGGVVLSFSFPTLFEIGESRTVKELPSNISESEDEELMNQENTLLIVEDNPEVQHLLKDMLSNNYKVVIADNGEEGIAAAMKYQPDLIISDIMMPKMDGTELTRTLKENFSTSHIPIILLTAKSAGHDKIAGLQTGADDYLTKPFSPKELRIRVRNLIEQRKKLQRRFSKNVFLMPEEITSTSLDQEFLTKATETVEENLQNADFNVDSFCRYLALNRNSVHQKLKSLTGKSASQFIKSVKLKKAATLIADERISIIEVSELSGFNNRQSFYKAFKDQFEMTPKEYRKDILEK
ncbi:MAG: response regulator [Crocinitomicaceae bacterium]